MLLEIDGGSLLDPLGAPMRRNAYVSCRLCPSLLCGGAAPHDGAGERARAQLRTEVCWGSSSPSFALRERVQLSEVASRALLSTASSAEPRAEVTAAQEVVFELWSVSDDTGGGGGTGGGPRGR